MRLCYVRLLLLAFILVQARSTAQTYVAIPNGSFENWVPAAGPAGAMNPTQWLTGNPGTATQLVPALSRSSDAVDGNWSVILRPLRGYDSVFGGYANQLRLYGPNPLLDSGIIIPRRFKGMYKFVKDSSLNYAYIEACFQGSALTVCGKGYGYFHPVPTSTWTPFSVAFDTGLSSGPVTGYSFLALIETQDTSANPISFLQLDALSLEYDTVATNAVSNPHAQSHLSIAPNPANRLFRLSWPDALPNPGVVLIEALTGQTLRQIPLKKGTYTLEADAAFLAPGQYVIRLIVPGYTSLPVRLVRSF